jgi:glycine dehydrogenase subunit 1
MGPAGMAELGELLLARTRYAQHVLSQIPGVSLGDDALHLREFTIRLDDIRAADLVSALRVEGIEPGVVVDDQTLLVCVTDATSASDIDRLASAIAAVLDTTKEQAK